MNKKIVVGVGIAVLTIVIVVVGFKTTLGDKAMGLPGEENTENALHLQESNGTTSSANITKSGESASTESSESGP